MVALPAAVADLAGYGQGLLVVVDGALVVAQGMVGAAQVAQADALPAAVADFAGYGQGLLVVVDGALDIAQVMVALPRLPRWTPSPRRSPISRDMARACSWYSMARWTSPRAR